MPETYAPDLPDGAVIVSAICVVSWIGDEGEMRYAIKTTGDTQLSTRLGLLDLARLDLYHEAQVDPADES